MSKTGVFEHEFFSVGIKLRKSEKMYRILILMAVPTRALPYDWSFDQM